MIEFRANTEAFEQWIIQVHNRFPTMIKTMLKIHKLLEERVTPNVPFETGRLESSFHPIIYDNSPSIIEMHSRYTAIDPYDGYDYAEYQHNTLGLHHPIKGEALFLLNGIQASESTIMTMIETDYLSLFTGGI